MDWKGEKASRWLEGWYCHWKYIIAVGQWIEEGKCL